MSVTKLTAAKLGEIVTNFLLNDWDAYIMNTSSTGGYVGTDWALLGYTGAEKTANVINEKYIREDKIPRVATYIKTIRKGFELASDLSNDNEEVRAIVNQGTRSEVTSANTGTRIAHGTDEAPIEYRAIRFVAERDDGVKHIIDIPKCEISQNGEQTLGGESEVVMPLMFRAVYNPSVDATANLYVENFLDDGISVTASVPDGYN